MNIEEKIPLDDLYFGVVMPKMSYSSDDERGELKTYNLFSLGRVKLAVAMYVNMSDEQREELSNPLFFCFGDVWGRAEYEFMICPWPYRDGDFVEQVGSKIDIFKMYVKPNDTLLMGLINRVTKSSAKAYISNYNKRNRK